mmetsp:Transcript_23577/g.32264  ORF Transcript_23577/g.32264 Transcript_23577/m.32264 type:complete len:88 (-) Transcript_23577:3384-3647(-)
MQPSKPVPIAALPGRLLNHRHHHQHLIVMKDTSILQQWQVFPLGETTLPMLTIIDDTTTTESVEGLFMYSLAHNDLHCCLYLIYTSS